MAQAENAKKLDYTPVTYDDQYILMVNQLKKYFPIKGGLMSQTVGHVKAVDGVTFNLKRGHTMGLAGGIRLRQIPPRPYNPAPCRRKNRRSGTVQRQRSVRYDRQGAA